MNRVPSPIFRLSASVVWLALFFVNGGVARASAAYPGLAALGSDLDGQWDGLLQMGGDSMPVTFAIASMNGKTTIVIDILEQKSQDIPVTGATRDGAKLHFDISAVDGAFDGQLTPDGAGIQGVWIQVGKRIPVTLKRRTPE